MDAIERRFGDEKSNLLDEFERISFEVHAAQLSRAMLRRSLSEPGLQMSQSRLIDIAPIPLVNQVIMQGTHHGNGHGQGFRCVLKKFLKPIFGKKLRGGRKHVSSDPKDIIFCNKAFSRSLRF